MKKSISSSLQGYFFLFALTLLPVHLFSQGTRLLQQPAISHDKLVFVYGGDLWVTPLDGGTARRLTSTPAVEGNPHFSPDGKHIAFSSNRSGVKAVYVVSADGGTPDRLTWYPASASVVGWTPDGNYIVYGSPRETAPVGYSRLWKVPVKGGPSEIMPVPRGNRVAFGPGSQLVLEPLSRWDVEWRNYRGGQNVPLLLMDLETLSETPIPSESTTDIHPVFVGDQVYFLSDRDWVTNVWNYNPSTGALAQITSFEGADIKWLAGNGRQLVFEREGYLHLLDPQTKQTRQLEIHVFGDFPWAETRLEDVTKRATNASLSPNGKRIVVEARGEVFTIPVENGSTRNMTNSPDAADRKPLWSPKGDQVAWFSDKGGQDYQLMLANQSGLEPPKAMSIGDAKMVWEPTWSPDGKFLAFVDNKVRVQVLDMASGQIRTAGTGGINIERGYMGLAWSPDSQWLAFSRTESNQFRRIYFWSVANGEAKAATDPLADAFSPTWDESGKYLYFLASTNLALASGWANTSAMGAQPKQAAYLMVLSASEKTPFPLKSDEETPPSDEKEVEKPATDKKKGKSEEPKAKEDGTTVKIDWDGLERRVLALPVPEASYEMILAGPKGVAFLGEDIPKKPGLVLHRFSVEDKKAEEFASGVNGVSISASREKLLFKEGDAWRVVSTASSPGPGQGAVNVELQMKLDRKQEWQQILQEAWRYGKDYFYDPGLHGRDWDEVKERYLPLIPFMQHRSDLQYALDQLNGELSVGHSFVFGGDFPEVATDQTGLLGADYELVAGRWRIKRIYTGENWNPDLKAPLDEPGLQVKAGDYLLAINGKELTAEDDIFRFFEGTAGNQVTLHLNSQPTLQGARTVVVSPVGSESGLRQKAWVEDNRRKVDELSNGQLAYVWVPNTSGAGYVSFNRYFFAQQDKAGAVIDERFNGGGLLDDYMVDLMTRKLRAAITNEVPNPVHFQLPAGILGPKVLLINELAGSGGDFFPWAFRNQQAGPLIGKRTWGGLVKSSVHYSFIDGGAMTAPDNAVFDPVRGEWIAENIGIAPDIEVAIDAKSNAEGRDIQLEKAVEEALKLLEKEGKTKIVPPAYPTPAVKPKDE